MAIYSYIDLYNRAASGYYDTHLCWLTRAERRKHPKLAISYDADERRLKELFRADCRDYVAMVLEDPFILQDDPFQALFDMAWEQSHAQGYAAVVVGLEDLVALIQLFM